MKLALLRTKYLPTGTLGTLSIDGKFECFTLERPSEQSGGPAPFCIPVGTYGIDWFDSPHFQTIVPLLKDVPGRTQIEIHPSNWISDLLGCIAVGETQSEGYVGESRAAFLALMDKIKDQEGLTIEITEGV